MFIFCFAFGFDFLIVATKVPVLLPAANPRIWSCWVTLKSNWSAVKSYVVPSAPIKEYLLGVNGWKVSSDPTVGNGVLICPLAIVTSNVFLITIEADVKSTLETFFFGRGV